jgi:hypothetical protein
MVSNNNSTSRCHLSNPGVQEWIDRENHVRVQFKYELHKPSINNFNQLNFSIQDSNTAEHLRNMDVSISIPTNEPIFQFDNITISNGDFDIICPFLKDGEHQVIINIHSGNLALALASFNMTVPSLLNMKMMYENVLSLNILRIKG